MPLIRPEAALNLAVFRITVPAIIVISPELWSAPARAALAPELRVAPEGLGWAVRLLPIEPSSARVAQTLLICACAAGILGLSARVALGIVTLAGLYVFGLSQLSGTVTHDMHLFWFTALLAASPCGDALSLDRLLARRDGTPAPEPALAYAVPLQAARTLLGVIYFFPGFWKLRTSAAAWVLSDNLRNQMYWKWYQMDGFVPALRIDRFPTLMHAGALAVVVFELSFIALVWTPRARLLAAAGGLAFHALAEIFLRIPFASLWVCYTSLVDWGRVLTPHTRSHGVQPRGRATWNRSRTLPAALLGSLLLAAATVQGSRGAMQAWPFACYPTFQWTLDDRIPDLRIEAVRADGSSVVVPDGPSTGGLRSQRRWGTVWQVAGLYGVKPDADRLWAYWALVRRDPRALDATRDAVAVRFYLAHYSVIPERFGSPPLDKRFLGELLLRTERLDRDAR